MIIFFFGYHDALKMLCSKMTSFPPSEGVSEIPFGLICSRSLWIIVMLREHINPLLTTSSFKLVLFSKVASFLFFCI